MRIVVDLGTRGCPGVLEDALRDYFGPVHVLVPVEPRLLGPALAGEGLDGGLAEVAGILRDRARERALAAAERGEGALADVFDRRPDVGDRVAARVLDSPIEDALARAARELEAEACYLARDALDVLDEAGIRPAEALEPAGTELVTR